MKTIKNKILLCSIAAFVLLCSLFFINVSSVKADFLPNSSFKAVDGASVRIDTVTGLRFTSEISDDFYNSVIEDGGYKVSGAYFGMIIVPASYYSDFQEQTEYSDFHDYLTNVKKKLKDFKYDSVEQIYVAEGKHYLRASIVNMYIQNYILNFIGVPYYYNGSSYIYASSSNLESGYTPRNIYSVAKSAIGSGEYTEQAEILNTFVDDSIYSAKGVKFIDGKYIYNSVQYSSLSDLISETGITNDVQNISLSGSAFYDKTRKELYLPDGIEENVISILVDGQPVSGNKKIYSIIEDNINSSNNRSNIAYTLSVLDDSKISTNGNHQIVIFTGDKNYTQNLYVSDCDLLSCEAGNRWSYISNNSLSGLCLSDEYSHSGNFSVKYSNTGDNLRGHLYQSMVESIDISQFNKLTYWVLVDDIVVDGTPRDYLYNGVNAATVLCRKVDGTYSTTPTSGTYQAGKWYKVEVDIGSIQFDLTNEPIRVYSYIYDNMFNQGGTTSKYSGTVSYDVYLDDICFSKTENSDLDLSTKTFMVDNNITDITDIKIDDSSVGFSFANNAVTLTNVNDFTSNKKYLFNLYTNNGVVEYSVFTYDKVFKTASEFNTILNTNASGYYALGADLDCSSLTLGNGAGTFSGTLDGRGYIVSNLNAKTNGIWNDFTGTIKNIAFTNGTGSRCFIAYNAQGTIENSYVEATVTTTWNYAGAFGKFNNGSNSVVKDCIFNIVVEGSSNTSEYVGALGVSCHNDNTIENTAIINKNATLGVNFLAKDTSLGKNNLSDYQNVVGYKSEQAFIENAEVSGLFTKTDTLLLFNNKEVLNINAVPEGYTLVSTTAEFAAMIDAMNSAEGKAGNYMLTADIDATGVEWTPSGRTFSGILDGNGHTVSNLASTNGQGLVKELLGTIRNIAFVNGTGSRCFLVYQMSGTLQNVYVDCNVTTSWTWFGVCSTYRPDGIDVVVKNCVFNSDVQNYDGGGGAVGAVYTNGKVIFDNVYIIDRNNVPAFDDNNASPIDISAHNGTVGSFTFSNVYEYENDFDTFAQEFDSSAIGWSDNWVKKNNAVYFGNTQVKSRLYKEIKTTDDFQTMIEEIQSGSVNNKYILMADIDASNVTVKAGSTAFYGVIDGNGHTVYNLTSTGKGIIDDFLGTIKNIAFVNAKTNQAFLGYGMGSGAVLENVFVDLTIDNASPAWYGVIGRTGDANTIIKNCVFITSVPTAGGSYVSYGGVFGACNTAPSSSNMSNVYMVKNHCANNVPFFGSTNNDAPEYSLTSYTNVVGCASVGSFLADVSLTNFNEYWSLDSDNNLYFGGNLVAYNTNDYSSYDGIIHDVSTLQSFINSLTAGSISGNWAITEDIDATNIIVPASSGTFSGTLDGLGHTISNLNVTSLTGMFKTLTGTVKNLAFVDCFANRALIAYEFNVGAVCENVYVKATISAEYGQTGIFGRLDGTSSNPNSIRNCVFDVSFTGSAMNNSDVGVMGCVRDARNIIKNVIIINRSKVNEMGINGGTYNPTNVVSYATAMEFVDAEYLFPSHLGWSDVWNYSNGDLLFGDNVIYTNYSNNSDKLTMKFGIWNEPADLTIASYKAVKDLGINRIFVIRKHSINELYRILELCDELGLEVIISTACNNNVLFDVGFMNFKSFKGISIKDEPTYDEIEDLAKKINWFESIYGLDKIFYVNLFNDPTGETDKLCGHTYAEYVEHFCEEILTNINGQRVLSFDIYPIVNQGTGRKIMESYLSNLAIISYYAKQYNALSSVFVQTMNFNLTEGLKRETPTAEELKLQIFTAMAYGFKSFNFFCYCPALDCNDNGLEGNATLRSCVDTLLDCLNNYDDMYLDFDYYYTMAVKGSIGNDQYNCIRYIDNIDSKFYSTSLSTLSSVTSNYDTVIGRFISNYHAGSVVGFMVSNLSLETNNVTLNFSTNVTEVTLFKADGTSERVSVSNNSITFTIAAGEGTFVVLD